MKKINWLVLIIEILMLVWVWQNRKNLKTEQLKDVRIPNISVDEMDIVEMKAVITVTPSPTLVPTKKPTLVPTVDSEPWGVSKQIDEVTWTMKVGEDEKIATAKEIFEALNEYRRRYGSQILNWDEKLGNYAQNRAVYLNSIKNVDKHEGFNNFVENEDGFEKLGFTTLGENISYGYKLNGVHIIEWMYAGDEPHNNNQLDNRWNYVGIGVDGLATCLIFGTGKM